MKQASFGNFQVGMVPDPSIEDQGGFEFAAGMDIFSEPGVMKANWALASCGLESLPGGPFTHLVETFDSSGILRVYVAAGDKIFESTNGDDFDDFLTNSEGTILGLEIWNGYVVYASASKIGRAPIGNAAAKDDDYITTLPTDDLYHPMVIQAGTLKIGAGRYVSSLDESFTLTAQAMKVPVGYRIKCLAEHQGKLFAGTDRNAPQSSLTLHTCGIFGWRGILQASGTALPDESHPLNARGVNGLASDGNNLYAFLDSAGSIRVYTGAGLAPYRETFPNRSSSIATALLDIPPTAVHAGQGGIFYGGNYSGSKEEGVYHLKDGVLCQAFAPSALSPGGTGGVDITLVKSAFVNNMFIGYQLGSTYVLEKTLETREQSPIARTVWHRMKTDRFKRFAGIRLNLKPMAANTAVTVAYRTSRDASFTTLSQTITSANQNKPVMFSVRPRAREIQFRFTFTTSGTATPELLSYDPIFETLNSMR